FPILPRPSSQLRTLGRNRILTLSGPGFCQIRWGNQNDENNSSVVTHLHCPDSANRHSLPASDHWNRSAFISEASERFTNRRAEQARRFGSDRAKIRSTALLLAK